MARKLKIPPAGKLYWPPVSKSTLMNRTVIHFHPCNPVLFLQTTASVLLYRIFFIQFNYIFGGIWRYNMEIRISKISLFRQDREMWTIFRLLRLWMSTRTCAVHTKRHFWTDSRTRWMLFFGILQRVTSILPGTLPQLGRDRHHGQVDYSNLLYTACYFI